MRVRKGSTAISKGMGRAEGPSLTRSPGKTLLPRGVDLGSHVSDGNKGPSAVGLGPCEAEKKKTEETRDRLILERNLQPV